MVLVSAFAIERFWGLNGGVVQRAGRQGTNQRGKQAGWLGRGVWGVSWEGRGGYLSCLSVCLSFFLSILSFLCILVSCFRRTFCVPPIRLSVLSPRRWRFMCLTHSLPAAGTMSSTSLLCYQTYTLPIKVGEPAQLKREQNSLLFVSYDIMHFTLLSVTTSLVVLQSVVYILTLLDFTYVLICFVRSLDRWFVFCGGGSCACFPGWNGGYFDTFSEAER